MSAITTKFVTDHKLTNEMSLEEHSQYVPEILELLTDDKDKRRQALGRCKSQAPVPEGSGLEAKEETIKEMAQRIVQDKLSEKDVKAISRSLIEIASDSVVGLSRLSRLRRELRTLNAPEKIISATFNPEVTRLSNKIQKERSDQCEDEGIDFPDHFLLESVTERLNLYDVSNIPDKQALADDIPQVFRSLEKNEKRARELLTWIQEAISSGQLRDSRKLGSMYLSTFLKKNKFIPETESHKPLVPSSLRKLGSVFASIVHSPYNLSKANTYASEALWHSPDNHASLSKRYTIVNMRKRGEPYNQIWKISSSDIWTRKDGKKLERNVASLETELEDLDNCVDKSNVVDLIHEIVPMLINEKGKSSSDLSDSSEESDSVETVRERKAVPYKQQRRARPKKVKKAKPKRNLI
ncbi:hypothetical protein C2G38_2172803 [Gigaspora rosea]|uniref:Uncharacterized protein n=1 Tax=Gigaspora rosea TaxID=44941 RepID=A0A397VK74_9GLOM|nr:hypothetical protein C2G38_2172803 [Gigaspora rosea]